MSVRPATRSRGAAGVAAPPNETAPPGDPRSLVEALYATCFDQLVGFLRSTFGAGPPPPEDLAQAAFERLLKVAHLRGDSNPRAFLWRTASNLAVSARRRSNVETRNLVDVETLFPAREGYRSTPERVVETEEDLEIVYKIISEMPEQRRSAFLLVRVDGLSHADAAVRLAISRPAVSKHVARATKDIIGAFRHD